MLSVLQFKNSVTPKLHGTTLAKVIDVYGKMREAAQNVLLRVDPPSIIRTYQIAGAIYDRVYNYPVADDLYPDSIVDIRPVGERRRGDDLEETFGKKFDIKKKENTCTIEYVNGVRTLRLSKCLTPQTTLARLDSLSGDGIITSIGDAGNLLIDYLTHVTGQASLQFDLSGATGQGGIAITLPSGVDLSRLLNKGDFFEWLNFTDVTRLTSVTLKWGDDAGNYWSSTVTAGHDRPFTSQAWVLLAHSWATASKTGSPTSTGANIKYLEVDFTYSAGVPIVAVHLDNISAALGEVWEIVYYSNRLFTDATGATWKEEPTDDSDLIRLDVDGINLLTYEFMLTLQQELKGKNMAIDYSYFRTQLYGQFGQRGIQLTEGLYQLFQAMYPSQVIDRQDDYYDFGELSGY